MMAQNFNQANLGRRYLEFGSCASRVVGCRLVALRALWSAVARPPRFEVGNGMLISGEGLRAPRSASRERRFPPASKAAAQSPFLRPPKAVALPRALHMSPVQG